MRLPKSAERQALEHDIGEAAIGRRVGRALLGDDQRIGLLVLAAAMDAAGRSSARSSALAVGPDAADAGDRALAEADREIGEVGIGGRS